MVKIVKNTTGSPYNVTDVGITIPSASQYTIPPQDFWLWAASSDVIVGIGSGDLVINDGAYDLNINQGTDWILGNFPRSIDVVASTTPTIDNVLLATADTEESYSIPAGTRQFQLKARGSSRVQLAFVSGDSSTTFITLYPGAMYIERNLKTDTLVLYMQASKANEIVEIISWA